MNKQGTKRKRAGSEPQNIKRWRSEITGYTGQEDNRNKQQKTAGKLTRKEKRKEGRKLKKMRKDAFCKHKALPTHESLAGQREAKVKQDVKRQKQKEKRKRSRQRKRSQRDAEREEEEAKQKRADEEIAKDDKIIKDLEKQMKMNKRKSKSLPQSFQNDGLDFILNVVDADNLKDILQDDDDDEDLTGPLLDSGSESDEDKEMEQPMESESDENDSADESDAEANVPELTETTTPTNVKGIIKSKDKAEAKKSVKFDAVAEQVTEKPKLKTPTSKKDILELFRKAIDDVKREKQNRQATTQDTDESEEEEDSESGESNPFLDSEAIEYMEEERESDNEDEGDLNENIEARKEKDEEEEEEEDDDDEEDDEEEIDDEDDEDFILNDSEEESEEEEGSHEGVDKDSEESEDVEDSEDDSSENEAATKKGRKLIVSSSEDNTESDSDKPKKRAKPIVSESEDDEGKSEHISEESLNSKYKEDIYGRLVDKSGKLVAAQNSGAYVPPGKRLQMASSQDAKKKLELERLKKQLKGLINRLSESNLQGISSQLEEMFRTRSRAELSESLTDIIMEACVAPTLLPERLLSEQMMLLAILQGNVGNEIGAVFLQRLVEQFNSQYERGETDTKEIDNMLVMLANMYNFKMFGSTLIFDIMRKLTESFQEKDIELLLVLLKNVGFSLRKDDPSTLKEVIVKVQEKAGSVNTSKFKDESRVKFMLEVLMAIRNNNMRKIPNYDPTHVEHLRKVLRNYTKGSSTSDTQLKISLEDLLNAEARGRWWLVGSAWSGRNTEKSQADVQTEFSVTNLYSEKILDLARQQRMNTDIRRNIFCIIMTCEDFVDAFEKLLRLNLKNQQEREIIHVIIDISLQEKKPNPFYAYLAQKFCEFHRRFQMTVQFNFWDRLKMLSEMTAANIKNLAAFMTHLISTKAISLSVFKVVEFSELDKHKLQLIRAILRALLTDQPDHVVTDVFSRVAAIPKLSALREALKVFMRHFLLRKIRDKTERTALEERIEIAERALGSSDSAMSL